MKQKLLDLIVKHTKLKKTEVEQLLTVPPDTKLGDYAFPCFKLGKKPHQEAQNLQKKIKLKISLTML